MVVLPVLLLTPCLVLVLMTWQVFISKERRMQNISSYLPLFLVIRERVRTVLVDALITEKMILSLHTALGQGRELVIFSVKRQPLGNQKVKTKMI